MRRLLDARRVAMKMRGIDDNVLVPSDGGIARMGEEFRILF